jgi:hypothetical protein
MGGGVDEEKREPGTTAKPPSSGSFEPPPPPKEVDVGDAGDEDEEEEYQPILRKAWPPLAAYFFDWLKTSDGKLLAEKVTGLFDSLQKRTLESQHWQAVIDAIGRYVLVGGIIAAATWLQTRGQLDAPIVGLLSGVVGYLLGRQRSK